VVVPGRICQIEKLMVSNRAHKPSRENQTNTVDDVGVT
jgi:hypothetical protein